MTIPERPVFIEESTKRNAESEDARNICSKSHSKSGCGDNSRKPKHSSDTRSAAAPAHSLAITKLGEFRRSRGG